MNDLENQWIAKAAVSKDTKYFGYLVKEHQGSVRGYLRRLTKGNEALSDDLAQETFIMAFRKISTYKGSGSFISWLLAIAYRNFLVYLRKQTNNPLSDNSHANIFLDDLQITGDQMDQSSKIIREMDIEKALISLGKNERSTISLCYTYGMSHGEISTIMNMPLGTVKSHILRGKEKLKTIFTAWGMDPNNQERVS